MNGLGIHTGLDLRERSLEFLQKRFGKSGPYYYWISRGIDHRPVRSDRIRKSVGAENTFFDDLTEFAAMREALAPIFDKLWRHCEASDIRGRTLTLKVKYADFQIITRSRTLAVPVASRVELECMSLELLGGLMPAAKGIRLLGVTLSGLDNEEPNRGPQMRLEL